MAVLTCPALLLQIEPGFKMAHELKIVSDPEPEIIMIQVTIVSVPVSRSRVKPE